MTAWEYHRMLPTHTTPSIFLLAKMGGVIVGCRGVTGYWEYCVHLRTASKYFYNPFLIYSRIYDVICKTTSANYFYVDYKIHSYGIFSLFTARVVIPTSILFTPIPMPHKLRTKKFNQTICNEWPQKIYR